MINCHFLVLYSSIFLFFYAWHETCLVEVVLHDFVMCVGLECGQNLFGGRLAHALEVRTKLANQIA